MKKLVLEQRKYGLIDLFTLPFQVCPFWLSLLTVVRLILSFLPALQVMAVAFVVDTAMAVLEGSTGESALLMPVLALLGVVAGFALQDFILFLLSRRVENTMNLAVQEALVQKRGCLEYRHIENNKTWDIITRAGMEAPTKLMEGYYSLMETVGVFLGAASVLWMVVTAMWWTGLLILFLCVPLFVFSAKTGKRRYAEEKQKAEKMRRADYYRSVLFDRELTEERSLFGFTDHINKLWFSEYMEAQKIRLRAMRISAIGVRLGAILLLLACFGIIAVLLVPLQAGTLTIGLFCGLVTALIQVVRSFGWEISWSIADISSAREYLEDFTVLANLSEKPDALTGRVDVSDTVFETLEFRDVSFAYPGTDRNILEHFNFTFTGGRNYAIVGINGAGKTTLTKLLCGLYDNYEGEILLNGKELRSYAPEFVKSFFGVVYQDFARYQVTLRENLCLGSVRRPEDDSLLDTLQELGMRQWVEGLPQGLDTPLGKLQESATDLSGGQWQRIAIARCLTAPAVMRILDEPTAALDPIAESEIYTLFSGIIKGRSSMIITHRLGAARMAEEIVVVEAGHVLEAGPHEELMARKGLYSELFESQRGWYL